jgi:hypothetical protein
METYERHEFRQGALDPVAQRMAPEPDLLRDLAALQEEPIGQRYPLPTALTVVRHTAIEGGLEAATTP